MALRLVPNLRMELSSILFGGYANTPVSRWSTIRAGTDPRRMSLALETVCGKLNLTLSDDPARRLVASKIIELAQRGVRDAPTLSEMTLKEFKH